MKGTYCIYSEMTGVFVSRWTGSRSQLAVNIPPGHQAREGSFDLMSKRVDLSTGEVVDYQPPQPDADHDWSEDTKRWRKRDEVLDWELQKAAALQSIEKLERQQARPLRELRKNPDDVEANRRLDEIDAEILALRQTVSAPKPKRTVP